MQARCIVFLDDEAETGRWLDRILATGLRRLPEVPLCLVGGQLVVRHRLFSELPGTKNASDKHMFRRRPLVMVALLMLQDEIDGGPSNLRDR